MKVLASEKKITQEQSNEQAPSLLLKEENSSLLELNVSADKHKLAAELAKTHERHRHDNQEANPAANTVATQAGAILGGPAAALMPGVNRIADLIQIPGIVASTKKKKKGISTLGESIIDSVQAARVQGAGAAQDGEDVIVVENDKAADKASALNASSAKARMEKSQDARGSDVAATLGNGDQSAKNGQENALGGPSKSLDLETQKAAELELRLEAERVLQEAERLGRASRKVENRILATVEEEKAEKDRIAAFRVQNAHILERNAVIREEFEKAFHKGRDGMEADLHDATTRAQNIHMATDTKWYKPGTNEELLWQNLRADGKSGAPKKEDWDKGYGPGSVYHSKEKLELMEAFYKARSGGKTLAQAVKGDLSFGAEKAGLALLSKPLPEQAPAGLSEVLQKALGEAMPEGVYAALANSPHQETVLLLRNTLHAADPLVALRQVSLEVGAENFQAGLEEYQKILGETYVQTLERQRAGEGVLVREDGQVRLAGDIPSLVTQYLKTGTLSEQQFAERVHLSRSILLSEAAQAQELALITGDTSLAQVAAARQQELQDMYDDLAQDPHAGLAALPEIFQEGSSELKVRADAEIFRQAGEQVMHGEYAYLRMQELLAHKQEQLARDYNPSRLSEYTKHAQEASARREKFLAQGGRGAIPEQVEQKIAEQFQQEYDQAFDAATNIYEGIDGVENLRGLSNASRDMLAPIFESRYCKAEHNFIQEGLTAHSRLGWNDGIEVKRLELTEALALYSGDQKLAERAALARDVHGLGSGMAHEKLGKIYGECSAQAQAEMGILPQTASQEERVQWEEKLMARTNELIQEHEKKFVAGFGGVTGYTSFAELAKGEFSGASRAEVEAMLTSDRDRVIAATLAKEFDDLVIDPKAQVIAHTLSKIVDEEGNLDMHRIQKIEAHLNSMTDNRLSLREMLEEGAGGFTKDAPATRWALSVLRGETDLACAHSLQYSMQGAGTKDEELRETLLPRQLRDCIAIFDQLPPDAQIIVQEQIDKYRERIRRVAREHEKFYLGGVSEKDDFSKFSTRLEKDLDAKYEAPVIGRFLRGDKLNTLDLFDFAMKGKHFDGVEKEELTQLVEKIGAQGMIEHRVEYSLRELKRDNPNISEEELARREKEVREQEIPNEKDELFSRLKYELGLTDKLRLGFGGDEWQRVKLVFAQKDMEFQENNPAASAQGLRHFGESVNHFAERGIGTSITGILSQEDERYHTEKKKFYDELGKLEQAMQEQKSTEELQVIHERARQHAEEMHKAAQSWRMMHNVVVDTGAEAVAGTLIVAGSVALIVPTMGGSIVVGKGGLALVAAGAVARPGIKMLGRGELAYEGVGTDILRSGTDVIVIPVGMAANYGTRIVLAQAGEKIAATSFVQSLKQTSSIATLSKNRVASGLFNTGRFVVREGVSGMADGAISGFVMGASHSMSSPGAYNGDLGQYLANAGQSGLQGAAYAASAGFTAGVTLPLVGRTLGGAKRMAGHARDGLVARIKGQKTQVPAQPGSNQPQTSPWQAAAQEPVQLVQRTPLVEQELPRVRFAEAGHTNNTASTSAQGQRIDVAPSQSVQAPARGTSAGREVPLHQGLTAEDLARVPKSPSDLNPTSAGKEVPLHRDLSAEDLAQVQKNLRDLNPTSAGREVPLHRDLSAEDLAQVQKNLRDLNPTSAGREVPLHRDLSSEDLAQLRRDLAALDSPEIPHAPEFQVPPRGGGAHDDVEAFLAQVPESPRVLNPEAPSQKAENTGDSYDPVGDWQRRREDGEGLFSNDWSNPPGNSGFGGGAPSSGGGGRTSVAERVLETRTEVRAAASQNRTSPQQQTARPQVSNSASTAQSQAPVAPQMGTAESRVIAPEPVATDYSYRGGSATGNTPASVRGNNIIQQAFRAARLATAMSSAQPMPMSSSMLDAVPLQQGAQAAQVVSRAAPQQQGSIVRTEFSTTVNNGKGIRTESATPKPAEVSKPATHTEAAPIKQDTSITDYSWSTAAPNIAGTHATSQATMQAMLHEEELEEAKALARKAAQKKRTAPRRKMPPHPGDGGGTVTENSSTMLPEDDIFGMESQTYTANTFSEKDEFVLDKLFQVYAVDDEHLREIIKQSGMGIVGHSGRWKRTEA